MAEPISEGDHPKTVLDLSLERVEGRFAISEASANSSISSSYSDYYQGIDWNVTAPTTAAYALIFLLGLSGNAMVIFAIHRCRRLHTVTSLLLGNLAVADLVLIILLIPVKAVIEVLDHWPFGEAVCRIVAYANIVSPTCSIYTMTVIALERCYAVLYPLETKSVITMGRTRRMIAIIWVFSLIMCIPSLFSKKTRDFDKAGDKWTTCNDGWPSNDIALGYTVYVTIVLFGFPTLVLAACYTLIVVRLYSGKRLTEHMRPLSTVNIPISKIQGDGGTTETEGLTSDDGDKIKGHRYMVTTQHPKRQHNKTEGDNIKRIVLMLILVVVVFVICWGPFIFYGLLLRAGLVGGNYTDTVWKISLSLHLLAYGNSCLNPFIYAFMSKSFREGFATACLGCRGREELRQRQWRQPSIGSSYNTRIMSISSTSANRV